jgi:hypothetical protein
MKKLIIMSLLLLVGVMSYGQTKSSYEVELERRYIDARTKTYSESQQKQALNGYTANQYVYARRLEGLAYDKAMNEVFQAYMYYEDKRTGRMPTNDLIIKIYEHKAAQVKQIDQANIKKNEAFFNRFPELLPLYKKLNISDLSITYRFYKYLTKSSVLVLGATVKEIDIIAFKSNNWLGIHTYNVPNSENALKVDDKGYYVYSTLENFLKDAIKLEFKDDVSITREGTTGRFKDLAYMNKYWEFYDYDKTPQGGGLTVFDQRSLPILPGHIKLKQEIEAKEKEKKAKKEVEELRIKAYNDSIEKAEKRIKDSIALAEMLVKDRINREKRAAEKREKDSIMQVKAKEELERIAQAKSQFEDLFTKLKPLFKKYNIKQQSFIVRLIIILSEYGSDMSLILSNNPICLEVKGEKWTYSSLDNFVKDLSGFQKANTATWYSEEYAIDYYCRRYNNGYAKGEENYSKDNVRKGLIFNKLNIDSIDENFNIK